MPHPTLRWFHYRHLPAGPMRDTSQHFAVLGGDVGRDLPADAPPEARAEQAACLRKLLEAKDCAVRMQRALIGGEPAAKPPV